MRRYAADRRIAGGKLSTGEAVTRIRRANDLGLLNCYYIVLTESRRLDHIASETIGDSGLWWVLAALSGIGWGLQVPAGTLIKIPNDINKIRSLVG